jgi:hypothetical protein
MEMNQLIKILIEKFRFGNVVKGAGNGARMNVQALAVRRSVEPRPGTKLRRAAC